MSLKEWQPMMTMEQNRYRVSTLEQNWEKFPPVLQRFCLTGNRVSTFWVLRNLCHSHECFDKLSTSVAIQIRLIDSTTV